MLAVPMDFEAKNGLGVAEILGRELRLDHVFDLTYLTAVSNDHTVINVESDVAGEPFQQHLLEPIQALVQLAHPVRVLLVNKPFWLSHQGVVLKECVEEGRVDVDCLYLKVVSNS
jgi:hypothetical protein